MTLHLGAQVRITKGACAGEVGVIRLRMGEYYGVLAPPHRTLQWYRAENLSSPNDNM